MIFAREVSDPLTSLVKKIDEATAKNSSCRMGSFVVFLSDDVQKTYEELAARGVEFQQPPKRESWGTSAIFKDQDGTLFALSSK